MTTLVVPLLAPITAPSVWYATPSARKNGGTHPIWKRQGYKTAIYIDTGAPVPDCADIIIQGEYEGYPKAVNSLCRLILAQYPSTLIIVTGGDDMTPDPNRHPLDIQHEFLDYFQGTFGVMQPTGDRWMTDSHGKSASERICGSPWMGKEFIQRMYGGKGPICEEYYHFFEDEELQEVTLKLGVLWQRPDLTHYHDHWLRSPQSPGNCSHPRPVRPDFLNDAKLDWPNAQQLFRTRKAAGFPGHEPLPAPIQTQFWL